MRDPQVNHFVHGAILPSVFQTAGEIEFAWWKIEKGLREKTAEEVTEDFTKSCLERGLLFSSSFTNWTLKGEDRSGRFVIKRHLQSHHSRYGAIIMEKIPSFALQMRKKDVLMSIDMKSGYHHLCLHPSIREYFLLYYGKWYLS